jgi:hypothetical protein
MIFDHAHAHSWATNRSVAEPLGCRVEALRRCLPAERDAGTRRGLTTSEREELRRLHRESFELKRAHEILRKARVALILPTAHAPR